ncbi:Pollen-specific protein [Thalictrum thalictroides]|uniref:Pollen-specific protein n=1 Tax=Thalictrum thalictroides TaxID=46969 RepID=A0A7J6WXB5_THATH|nr:Pollen-specific protein [Thalictrum thalictroides]
MAKFLILLALCVLLPAYVSAVRPLKFPFVVHGKVFCDTCQLGFETPASTYIAGAKVRIVCRNRDSLETVFSCDAVTDKSGSYSVTVAYDHDDQICESVLISSPQEHCAKVLSGREKAPVFLTSNNGINSNDRFANNLGFVRDAALAGCTKIKKLYEEEV